MLVKEGCYIRLKKTSAVWLVFQKCAAAPKQLVLHFKRCLTAFLSPHFSWHASMQLFKHQTIMCFLLANGMALGCRPKPTGWIFLIRHHEVDIRGFEWNVSTTDCHTFMSPPGWIQQQQQLDFILFAFCKLYSPKIKVQQKMQPLLDLTNKPKKER